MMPIQAVVDRLKADGTLAPIVGDRVYDHDVRRSKHPEIFDTNGFVLPTISVDDRGGTRPPFAQDDAFQDFVHILAFVNGNAVGRQQLKTMMARSIALLNGWQHPGSKVKFTYADRFGDQASALQGGAMDYARFSAVGVHLGIAI